MRHIRRFRSQKLLACRRIEIASRSPLIEVTNGSPASFHANYLSAIYLQGQFPPLLLRPESPDYNRPTDAIEGNASPRKPLRRNAQQIDLPLLFFESCVTLEGQCMASSRTMPQPLSAIRISFFPPASTWNAGHACEPASSAFSNNSFTTDAGSFDDLAGSQI